MARKLKGGFEYAGYRLWKIKFPYMTEKYVYGGSQEGARKYAMRIQKRKKWPYAHRPIREFQI